MSEFPPASRNKELWGILTFPAHSVVGNQDLSTDGGMELRDYFAAKVMAQIEQRNPKGHENGWDGMASLAYAYADAMIRVRAGLRKPKMKTPHIKAIKANQ